MKSKVEGFLEISAAFGEAFLRRSGRGILNGVHSAFHLIGQFALIALAVIFATQFLEAQKACELKSVTPLPPIHSNAPKPKEAPAQAEIGSPEAVTIESGAGGSK